MPRTPPSDVRSCHDPPASGNPVVKYQALSQVVKWATHTYSSKPFAEVEDGSCLRSGCHDRNQLAAKKTFKRGVIFDHASHLADTRRGPRLRCTSCHTQVVVSPHMQVSESTCFLCHFKGAAAGRELQPVAGCTGCHQTPPGEIVLGTVRFSHEEVRRRGVACQSCHLNVVEGDGAAPRERCLTCHNQPDKLARYGDQPFIHAAHVSTHNIECGRCHTTSSTRLPPPSRDPRAAGVATHDDRAALLPSCSVGRATSPGRGAAGRPGQAVPAASRPRARRPGARRAGAERPPVQAPGSCRCTRARGRVPR